MDEYLDSEADVTNCFAFPANLFGNNVCVGLQ